MKKTPRTKQIKQLDSKRNVMNELLTLFNTFQLNLHSVFCNSYSILKTYVRKLNTFNCYGQSNYGNLKHYFKKCQFTLSPVFPLSHKTDFRHGKLLTYISSKKSWLKTASNVLNEGQFLILFCSKTTFQLKNCGLNF